MTTVRSAKVKGSSFEYDCQHSLKSCYPDIYRTSERGFQMQYDLRSDNDYAAFECKRLKSMSWNQAVVFFTKLKEKAIDCDCHYLLFKSNNQPCLVMYDDGNGVNVTTFENYFMTKFEKHPSTRKH